MNLDLFKKIIDQAENNIEFMHRSRGEPLISKNSSDAKIYRKKILKSQN